MCKKILAMALSFSLALSVGFPSNATVSGNDAVSIVEEEAQLEKTEQELVVEEVCAEEEPILYLAGNFLAEATEISFEQEYSGMIFENTTADYYKFELESSGRLNLDVTAQIRRVTYKIYDGQGNELWDYSYSWNDTTEQSVVSKSFDLTKGTYYFVVEKYSYYSYTGTYDFKLSFTSANESFIETGYGTNNGMSTASAVDANTNYKGQIAYNDGKDFYKITLDSSGRLILDATAQIREVRYRIYDEQGNAIWNTSYSWNETTKQSVVSKSFDLTKGTYYFVVQKYGYTGDYSFNIKHTHVYKEKTTKATLTENGKIEKLCSCGEVHSSKTIYYPKTIKLDKTSYVYNGKVRTPSVIVKDAKGKALKKGTDYTVSFDKGRKKVGEYEVKVKLKGKYQGTKTLTFTIKPKACQHTSTKSTTTKATAYLNGKVVKKCTDCNKVIKTSTIYNVSIIKLDKTSYEYDGEVKTPSVIVKNAEGKTLKEGTDYTTTFDKGRKKVGEYKVRVKLKGKYQGTKTLTFTIKP